MEFNNKLKKDLAKAINRYGVEISKTKKVLKFRNIFLVLLANQFLVAAKEDSLKHFYCIKDCINLEVLSDYLKSLNLYGNMGRLDC